jgi:hypothetical protein
MGWSKLNAITLIMGSNQIWKKLNAITLMMGG